MKKHNTIYASLVLVLGFFLSLFVLATPMPNYDSEDEFNVTFATEYIAQFSKEPHSVYDPEAHEEVRLYLKGKLTEFLGEENVYEMDYDRSLVTEEEIDYDIRNLLGVIEGESETGILIVGHYDSRGHIGRTGELGESYGAADDGYALAVMLEIARLYADQDLENSIYILVTDAEETGLYGAYFAAQETDLMDDIGFVLNIEARGTSGPAYMFETSVNNDKIIDFYTNADYPVSYSLATAVYTVMPNNTDFTEFLAIDKNGINFAVLEGLENYHTPLDNYTNINQASIQHYGSQILPLVEEFVMNEEYSDVDYFDSDQDQVFFNLYSNVFIHYGEGFATVVHIVLLLLLVGVVVYQFMKKDITIQQIGKASLYILGAIVAAVLVGQIVGRIIAAIAKVPFNITYVRTTIGSIPTLLTLLLFAAGVGYLFIQKANDAKKAVLVVGTFLNILLALATGLILSGASFLFLVAGCSGLIVLGLQTWCKSNLVKMIVYGLVVVINLLILVPIIYSLYLAITVGGLLAFLVISVFYLVILVPTFDAQLHI